MFPLKMTCRIRGEVTITRDDAIIILRSSELDESGPYSEKMLSLLSDEMLLEELIMTKRFNVAVE
jgi:hypothetical protein